MTNALVPFDQLNTMAEAFAKSGLFGAKNKDQAMALLLLAQAEGVHPAIAMRDFDIINGKPAKKAEAVQRAFLEAGGKIEWHKYDDTGAEATFSHPQGGTIRLGWDAERAKKAGLSGKDMYAKYGRQMYGSRTISEGVRKVYPAATSGMYVPEEVREFKRGEPKDMGDAVVVPPAEESSAKAKSYAAKPKPEAESEYLAVTEEQIEAIHAALAESSVTINDFLKQADVTNLEAIASEDAPAAVKWLQKRRRKEPESASREYVAGDASRAAGAAK